DKRLNEPETQKQPADEEQKTGSNPAPSTTINVGVPPIFEERSLNPQPPLLFCRWSRWSQLQPEVKGKLLRLFAVLEGRKAERTIQDYMEALVRVAEVLGSLDDVKRVADFLGRCEIKWIRKHGMAGYNHYVRVFGLPMPKYDFQRDPRRQLPRIPPEKTLQASIVACRRLKWQAYFRLLYETGARPSEPFQMRVKDVDFENCKVRLGTFKRSGYTTMRELPISELLTAQLKKIAEGKQPEEYLFTKTRNPKEPLTYKQALDVITKIKRQLKQAGYSIEGLRLHIYRHAFGTRTYQLTRDLAITAQALGHRNIEDTMIYIHLRPDQPRRFDVENCRADDKEAISRYLAEGWELALQTQTEVFFKRPRWVP
ncbi:MAG: site-specific integrase, partial [Candidatus Bathyarchaeia archaeon]